MVDVLNNCQPQSSLIYIQELAIDFLSVVPTLRQCVQIHLNA